MQYRRLGNSGLRLSEIGLESVEDLLYVPTGLNCGGNRGNLGFRAPVEPIVLTAGRDSDGHGQHARE